MTIDREDWRRRLDAIRNAEAEPEPKKPAMAGRPMTEAEAALIDSLLNGIRHRQENQNLDDNATERYLLNVIEERQTPELFERGVAIVSELLRAQKAASDYWTECYEIGIGNRRVRSASRGSRHEDKTAYDIYREKITAEAKRRTGLSEP